MSSGHTIALPLLLKQSHKRDRPAASAEPLERLELPITNTKYFLTQTQNTQKYCTASSSQAEPQEGQACCRATWEAWALRVSSSVRSLPVVCILRSSFQLPFIADLSAVILLSIEVQVSLNRLIHYLKIFLTNNRGRKNPILENYYFFYSKDTSTPRWWFRA